MKPIPDALIVTSCGPLEGNELSCLGKQFIVMADLYAQIFQNIAPCAVPLRFLRFTRGNVVVPRNQSCPSLRGRGVHPVHFVKLGL